MDHVPLDGHEVRMDTEKLTHNIESETEGSVDEQKREMDNCAAGATQAD